MKWSMELSQYKIRYLLRAIVKRQAIDDFIAKLASSEELN